MKVVLDTNVLVAAAFNRQSSSAQIIRAVESGAVKFVWNTSTEAESRKVLNQIPPISWSEFESLFTAEREFRGASDHHRFQVIQDPDDRKFAALAAATDAVLVSNDEDLLSVRSQLDITVLTPGELVKRGIGEG